MEYETELNLVQNLFPKVCEYANDLMRPHQRSQMLMRSPFLFVQHPVYLQRLHQSHVASQSPTALIKLSQPVI